MGTITQAATDIRALLAGAGVYAVFGPATSLPTTGGKVAQAAVLWPTVTAERYRADGRPADRPDGVRVQCVGATTFDALAVATKVRAALAGARLDSMGKGGTVREATLTDVEPTPEPGTDPLRVSLPLLFTFITKGIR